MTDPDRQHTKYYEKNPNGNHDMPSPETLRFMGDQKELNNQLMKDISDIKSGIAEIKTILTSFITSQKEEHAIITKKISEDSDRIDGLEKWRSYIAGGWIVITVLFTIVQFVLPLLKK